MIKEASTIPHIPLGCRVLIDVCISNRGIDLYRKAGLTENTKTR